MTAERDRLNTSDLAAPRGETGARSGDTADSVDRGSSEMREQPLLPLGDLEGFRDRWESVQTNFVDEPRRAVAEADELVAEVMQRLADTFSRERSQLEGQWDRGDDVSTEELRVSLQRYRNFFSRLIRI